MSTLPRSLSQFGGRGIKDAVALKMKAAAPQSAVVFHHQKFGAASVRVFERAWHTFARLQADDAAGQQLRKRNCVLGAYSREKRLLIFLAPAG
jgi:hypothetical protein